MNNTAGKLVNIILVNFLKFYSFMFVVYLYFSSGLVFLDKLCVSVKRNSKVNVNYSLLLKLLFLVTITLMVEQNKQAAGGRY